MKEFWKDYKDLCKHSLQFSKKHWKGLVVLNVAVIGAELGYFYIQQKRFDKQIETYRKETEVQ